MALEEQLERTSAELKERNRQIESLSRQVCLCCWSPWHGLCRGTVVQSLIVSVCGVSFKVILCMPHVSVALRAWHCRRGSRCRRHPR
jgi:hypothetical protein